MVKLKLLKNYSVSSRDREQNHVPLGKTYDDIKVIYNTEVWTQHILTPRPETTGEILLSHPLTLAERRFKS